MGYLLTGATCLEPSPPKLFRADVLTEGGSIVEVAPRISHARGHEQIDFSGKILMPGNVCAHTHLYSSLARGLPGPAMPPKDFVEILERIWWRLDRALDRESIYVSALIGALEAVRAGTTCLVDHHASPESISGSLDLIARAIEDVGLRGILCYEITDRGGMERRDAGVDETAEFLGKLQANPSALIRGMVGGHASFTLSDETLERGAALTQRFAAGFHVHAAEDAFDERDARNRYGLSVIDRFARHGLLGPRTILAHGVHLSDDEIATAAGRGAWLVHNPRSNLNNSVGRARAERFGNRAALGTDGIGADVFEESRFGFFRARESDRYADAERYLAMASAGAQLASEAFGVQVGRMAKDSAADLIVLDYDPPTPLSEANLSWHWMFGLNATFVESVMVNGRWIIRDRQFVSRDAARDLARGREVARALWQRVALL